MTVKRIVANIHSAKLEEMTAFYMRIFDLDLVMNHGWIQTYASTAQMRVQMSVAIEGGSNTVVPDLSIEVDNFDEVLQRVKDHAIEIFYGPVTEEWGVRRFYIEDPSGRILNVLQHIE